MNNITKPAEQQKINQSALLTPVNMQLIDEVQYQIGSISRSHTSHLVVGQSNKECDFFR